MTLIDDETQAALDALSAKHADALDRMREQFAAEPGKPVQVPAEFAAELSALLNRGLADKIEALRREQRRGLAEMSDVVLR